MKVLHGAFAGLLAGLVASWVMEQFQAAWTSRRPLPATGGEPTTATAADRLTIGVADHRLSETEKRVAGPAMHYAMGALTGTLYGAGAELVPALRSGLGIPYGAAVWVAADEIALPALGLSGSPLEVPAATNAYALASHLVYGLTLELVRAVLRPLL